MASQHGRHNGGQTHSVRAPLVRGAVNERAPVLYRRQGQQRCSQRGHRIPKGSHRVDNGRGLIGQSAHSANVNLIDVGGQCPINQQGPDVLEGTRPCQPRRIMLPVVEEPLLSADRPQFGVGYGETLQSWWCDFHSRLPDRHCWSLRTLTDRPIH